MHVIGALLYIITGASTVRFHAGEVGFEKDQLRNLVNSLAVFCNQCSCRAGEEITDNKVVKNIKNYFFRLITLG